MKFAVLVQVKPEHTSAKMIYRFVEAALKKNHSVEVFFYEDGVYHIQNCIHSSTYSNFLCWQNMAKKYTLNWRVCSGSLQRRGIWFQNLSGFTLSGLAHFMECLIHADRVLTFYK